MDDYFSGRKLYGDDFSPEEIDAWFADEAEGYFALTKDSEDEYSYGYHELNKRHGYSALPNRKFAHVLGIGSAYGEELRPILTRCERISILEPSDGFKNAALDGVPLKYFKPVASGEMPFAKCSVDLITCFGVLHHIPNVSRIVNEFFRVLKPGGYVLVREPIISMGDWRNPRVGLTKRERGIPLQIMGGFVRRLGFDVLRERKCMFSLTSRLRYIVSGPVYNNRFIVAFDAAVSSFPFWPKAYHAKNALQKLRPTSVYYVLRKPGQT